jgi:hypothetical protein
MASGKSELARELASRWSCPRASFGALVSAEASERGAQTDRDGLQELGRALIKELGWTEFCGRTLALAGADWTNSSLVIDGVRHVEAIETLRVGFAPSRVALACVACDEPRRIARLLARGAGPADIERWDRDSTERNLDALSSLADLTVRGDQPIAEAVHAIEALN